MQTLLEGIEIIAPEEIEKRSFQIIREELGENFCVEELKPIVVRVVHTTADFEFAKILKTGNDFINRFASAIKGGATIVTDTRMAYSGISKHLVEKFGGRVLCFMDDPEVAKEAQERHVTRASICMERASKLDEEVIIAIGNAPTALLRVCELVREGVFVPQALVGVPVGFVNVVESKNLLKNTDIPYIISEGRKGGSNVAAAIVNAMLRMV